MPVSEKQKEYSKKYLDKFDEIKIRLTKGTKERWKTEAAKRNKSLNQFVVDSVENEIENT